VQVELGKYMQISSAWKRQTPYQGMGLSNNVHMIIKAGHWVNRYLFSILA
jgi:hypothetical protein